MWGMLKGRAALSHAVGADAEELAGGDAGADVGENLLLGLAHLGVDVHILLIQLADHDGTGKVGKVVTLADAAEVQTHLVAAAHDVVGGQGVDQDRLLAGAHDKEVNGGETVDLIM